MNSDDIPNKIFAYLGSSGLKFLPLVVLGPIAAWFAARFLIGLGRYLVANSEVRPMIRKARVIKSRWKRDARRVGLMQIERGRPRFWSSTPATTPIEREMIPPVTVKAERWGVSVDASTLGRLGLNQFQEAALYLADIWKVPQVRAEQLRPGVVRLRAIIRDPLTEPAEWAPATVAPRPRSVASTPPRGKITPPVMLPWTLPADPQTWHAGVDADGEPVTIRSSGVSGVVVAGLAGYGKTSFLNARLALLAPSPVVQFVLIDGKGGPDYDDLFRRAWHLGPSPDWPLVVVVIDEAHTFLNETKGSDAESKRLDALSRETARLVEELIRKGRNVGIQVIVATQKATADAIPTKIRDNCQVAVSFAQRTSEAATAILGSDITSAPDEHPRRLQYPAYLGVASMVANGRPGFTLVRTPFVSDDLADITAAQTAHLVRDPLQLLTAQRMARHALPRHRNPQANLMIGEVITPLPP